MRSGRVASPVEARQYHVAVVEMGTIDKNLLQPLKLFTKNCVKDTLVHKEKGHQAWERSCGLCSFLWLSQTLALHPNCPRGHFYDSGIELLHLQCSDSPTRVSTTTGQASTYLIPVLGNCELGRD